MVFNMKDAERMMKARMEMEDLCSKLVSLIPRDYLLDTTSQSSSDPPSQLMQAATYIKDLRERVEKLKRRRDDCYAKIQQAPGSCSQSQDKQDVRVQFNGAADFDVNMTMSSEKCVELYKVIQTIEQDRCIEIVEASSCLVEDGKTTRTIKCRARSSEVVLDASMVTTRLKRLLTASLVKPEVLGSKLVKY